MKLRSLCGVGVLGMVATLSVSARSFPDPAVHFAPLPNWVRPVPMSASALLDARRGDCVLLDHQIEVTSSKSTLQHFKHVFIGAKFGTPDQDGAPFFLPLEASTKVLWAHEIKIWRAKLATIDVLFGAQTRSAALNGALVRVTRQDGQKKLRIQPAALQPGDVLEISWTEVTSGERFGSRFDGLAALAHASCTGTRNLRLGREFAVGLHYAQSGHLGPARYPSGGGVEWSLPPSGGESVGEAPDSHASGYVQFSQFDDWSTVANWARKEFDLPSFASDRVHRLVRKLTAKDSEQEAKMKTLIGFVQDNIAYQVETDRSSLGFRPVDPSMTLRTRKGDCKAKSKLLIEMLQSLGVQSHPVLVSTFFDLPLTSAIPSPRYFDHVVVRVNMGDYSALIDPTQSAKPASVPAFAPRQPRQGLELKAAISTPSIFAHD